MLQRLLLKVKSKSPSSTTLKDPKKNCQRQSLTLDNARTIFQLASNLGSGALNVPGLQAAGLIGVQIIDIVKKARSNKQDAEDLVNRISELMEPILDSLQNRSARDIDPSLKADIERFQQDLEKIRDVLCEQNGRGRFSRVVNSVGDSESIIKCKEIIDHSFKRFQIYTFISLRLNATEINNARQQNTPESKLSDVPTQPVAPKIFFGREEILERIVPLFSCDSPCYVAFVGSGGIGKTSTGLHIFHHSALIKTFDPHRYFVACDAITTAEALALMILKVLWTNPVAGENAVTTLHRVLMALPPTVLFLDNFETPWDSESNRTGVEGILSKIGATTNVSLILTTRIQELPSSILWTYEVDLAPLSLDAAKQTYFAINTSRKHMDDANMKTLDDLLKELDYVPLAIRLLATVGKGYSPAYLLRQWKEERTELLDLHKDRQGSIAVSISLSLSQLRITNNPEAVQLLGVLSLLPDGMSCWTERISQIGHGFNRVHHLARVLLQTSLCFLQGETLKVLSPIRHYILNHNPAATHHVRDLERHYWTLIRVHSKTPLGPEFPEARKVLDPEMGNILGLVRNAIQSHPSLNIIEITIDLSWYFSNTIPSIELLMEIEEQTKRLCDTSTVALRLEVLGQNLYLQCRYAKAYEYMKEARDKFYETGDITRAARCSQCLGENLYMQGRDEEATAMLQEAREKFIDIGSVLGAAHCLRALGGILYAQSRYDEATDVLQEAREKLIEIDNVLGASQCLQSLGEIRSHQHDYVEASTILSEAREQFLKIGYKLGAAQSLQALGDNFRFEGKYVEANEQLIKARDEFSDIGNSLGAE